MKKQVSLMMAAGLLAFASCNSGNTDNSASQAQIDSTVNARVESIRTEMMMKNDSIINAMAQMKADSIIAAMKGEKAPATVSRTTHTTSHTSTPVSQPAASTNTGGKSGLDNIKSHSDQNAQSGLDKIKSHSDQNSQSGLQKIKSHSDQNKGK